MDANKPISLAAHYGGFNPRARDGRERYLASWLPPPSVSIHAPVMDANSKCLDLPIYQGFNPRARDGRESHGFMTTRFILFQSTRP